MKKLAFSLLAAAAALVSTSNAGTQVYAAGKEYKAPVVPEVGCFLDQELQIDIYGAYNDGNGHNHAGPIREHGWGGGVGINYFFARNIGIGVDATWIYADENAAAGNDDSSDNTVFHNITGSLIFRFPIDEMCLAPYAFIGGGFHVDGDQWASAHAGLGLEYRIVPNKVGLFTDARWTYFGDRYGHGDQNNVLVKAGVRFVF
jgi:hypothetical protein